MWIQQASSYARGKTPPDERRNQPEISNKMPLRSLLVLLPAQDLFHDSIAIPVEGQTGEQQLRGSDPVRVHVPSIPFFVPFHFLFIPFPFHSFFFGSSFHLFDLIPFPSIPSFQGFHPSFRVQVAWKSLVKVLDHFWICVTMVIFDMQPFR